MRRISIACCVALSLSSFSLQAAQVTINPAVSYQTIEGFGGFGPSKVWWDAAPFYTNAWVQQVVEDLGLTMVRTTVPASFEYTNDNNDPAVTNMAGYNISAHVSGEAETHLGDHFAFYRELKSRMESNNEQCRIIATVWTPPAWMKTNNDIRNGGNLRTDRYTEFAEMCYAYVRTIKDQCNIDLYGLNIQNEPAFLESYESCVYSPQQYRDALKVAGPRVHAAYPNVKMFGAEHMLANWGTFEGLLMQDTAAKAQLGAFAVHGYTDGVTPQPGGNASTLWNRAWRNASGAGLPLWMTETSGYANDWTGAFQNAEAIYAALRFGHISAWTLWYTCDNMYTGGTPDKRYYAHKQFARYIRPGARGIDCSTDDSLVLPLAFTHATNQTLTIVLMNSATGAKQVTIGGGTLPQFTAYRSSSTENCINAGTVSGTVSLPGRSITTLYGTNYTVGVTVPRPMASAAATGATARATFTLDGRLARSPRLASLPSGVYLQTAEGVNGSAQKVLR